MTEMGREKGRDGVEREIGRGLRRDERESGRREEGYFKVRWVNDDTCH